MGLDMYLFATDKSNALNQAGFPSENAEEIGYWRKHPDLHSFIESLWRNSDQCEDESISFNGVPYVLSEEDIKQITLLSALRELPTSEGGFFFGESRPEHIDKTIEFMREARLRMLDGQSVVYDSSW